jgi:tellurite resistance protein TerC
MPQQVWLWSGFIVFVLLMLSLDLGVFHRKAHQVSLREALIWTAVWIALALLFNAGLWYWRGPEPAMQFLAGYLIEKALSVDNIFVFVMIFSFFHVPALYQHKILFWGILSALVMRAIFIAAGVALLEHFHWLIYVFGAFLIITGIKMAVVKDKKIHPERNPVLKLFRRLMPVTDDYEGDRFFIRRDNRLWATPMFIALLFVELTDLIFAVDSIPAILAITQDAFIVYTSNVFAILGLRSLYFALAGIMRLFRYLHYGLALILVFVGAKMSLVDIYPMPVAVSLGVVAGILVVSVVLSLLRPDPEPKPLAPAEG